MKESIDLTITITYRTFHLKTYRSSRLATAIFSNADSHLVLMLFFNGPFSKSSLFFISPFSKSSLRSISVSFYLSVLPTSLILPSFINL